MKPDYKRLNQRFEALQTIVVELIAARDPRATLQLVLEKAIDLLECDAGSLYLKHNDQELIFELAYNQSINYQFEKRVIPISGLGIANYCYNQGKPLRISDVYELTENDPYRFDRSFDRAVGYRTKSVLVQPLKSSRGEMLGVLQLINRKKNPKARWPSQDPELIAKMPDFSEDDQRFLSSFAAISSATIENAELYKNIEDLFEGFVKASIDAIETRDPPTRGHSERVALLTVDLAKKVSLSQDRTIRKVAFTDNQIAELRYAALLHDFGKIGVRENTLLKNNKLFDNQFYTVLQRIKEYMYVHELEDIVQLMERLKTEGRAPNKQDFDFLADRKSERERQSLKYQKALEELNRPTVLDEDKTHRLKELIDVHFKGIDGENQRILYNEEIQALSISRGSLSELEREEIQTHVSHTYKFLKKIPWTKEYSNIPQIAWAHHEKLDGSGYPRGLKAPDIPPQAKIMTICDIYDALVANDRPYKPAVPEERALGILEAEAKGGKVDPQMLKVFIEARVYRDDKFLDLAHLDPSNKKKKAA